MSRRIMPLILSTFGLTAGFAPTSFAQTGQVLDFKPGEVIVGYATEADRRASERLFKSTPLVNSFNLLGGQKTQKVEVTPRQNTSILLKFSLPPGNNAFADGDPASQRRLIDDLANQIKKMDPKVKYVYPNYLMGIPVQKPITLDTRQLKKLLSATTKPNGNPANTFPNDPSFTNGLQWDYQALPIGMNAIGAWKITTGDRRIVVAVVDTGILLSHPDVVGSGNLLPGYNFVSDGAGRSNDPSDPSPDAESHGSNVASIIGAVATNNNLDVAGINWAVSVLPVRALNEERQTSLKDIADGILWAAGLPVAGVPTNPSPADVINLSLGSKLEFGFRVKVSCNDVDQSLLRLAIEKARAAGAVIVVAAGNGILPGNIPTDVADSSPANCPGVISVAAHDNRGRLASYSNFGNVSIVAPGGENNIPVLGIGGTGTQGWSGTSQAAPHVAGAIALAMAKHEEWRRHPDIVATAIHDSAVPMPAGACSHPCGAGQLDAQRLIEYEPASSKPPLTAAVSPPSQSPQRMPKIRTASVSNDFSGRWLMSQGGALIIRDDEWSHPSKGTASISIIGQQNILVRYPQQTGVTCSYRAMLMDNGSTLHLEPTNAVQPDEFCPSGKLASGAQRQTAASTAQIKSEPGQSASNEIIGRWLMNTGGILEIEKGEWMHPNKGSADLMLDGSDKLIVQYPQQTGVKCSYRTVLLDNGQTLQLVPTHNLQPEEYCPAGRLTASP